MSNTGEIDVPRRRTKENRIFDKLGFMSREGVRKMAHNQPSLGQAQLHKLVM